MTNVKYYMFWIIMVLALVFWLRGLESETPKHNNLGSELFTEEPISIPDFSEDPLF